MLSKITSKFQITIPREIRNKLKLGRNDSIEWVMEDSKVYIRQSKNSFEKFKGSIAVGEGDIENDINRAKRIKAHIYHNQYNLL